jgi:hypothetical protein
MGNEENGISLGNSWISYDQLLSTESAYGIDLDTNNKIGIP